MIFLNVTTIGDPILGLESILIIGIIFLQIYLSYNQYINIGIFKNIFNANFSVKDYFLVDEEKAIYLDKEGVDEYSKDIKKKGILLIDTNSKNEINKNIASSINSYLKNNYGASVNFSIIKEIIDKEIDALDEKISTGVQTPLYLGLAATMLGIIFGLFAMPDLQQTSTMVGINALINGVKIAMTASLTGLICTTILSSWLYKDAKGLVAEGKSRQVSYLLANLLPELIKAEETGLSGLKQSIDSFSRNAAEITNNISAIVTKTEDNLSIQYDIVNKVDNMKMPKLTQATYELFSKLDANMDKYQTFSTYLTEMKNISHNLARFGNQTSDIEQIASKINTNIDNANKVFEFLTAHIAKIENSGDLSLQAVNMSEVAFSEAIDLLKKLINEKIESIDEIANATEIHIKETFEEIGNKLQNITQNHLELLTQNLKNAQPRFEKLDKLDILEQVQKNSNNNEKQIIEGINNLTHSLNKGGGSSGSNNINQNLERLCNIIEKRERNRLANRIKRINIFWLLSRKKRRY